MTDFTENYLLLPKTLTVENMMAADVNMPHRASLICSQEAIQCTDVISAADNCVWEHFGQTTAKTAD